MNRWHLLCADDEIHGMPYRSFGEAEDAQLVLDESPYTHCGPHRVEPGAGVAAPERVRRSSEPTS